MTDELFQTIDLRDLNAASRSEHLMYNEWLLTNGLGGYASTAISGAITRKYHGLLVAALPAPLGRTIMLSYLYDFVRLADGENRILTQQEFAGEESDFSKLVPYLKEFRTNLGLPRWLYEVQGSYLEKSLFMAHLQNTVLVTYHYLEGDKNLELHIHPYFNMRHHELTVRTDPPSHFDLHAEGDRYEFMNTDSPFPPVRFKVRGDAAYYNEFNRIHNVFHRIEAERGYDSNGDMTCPGHFVARLSPGQKITLVVSTENWEVIEALSTEDALNAELGRRNYLLLEAEKHIPNLRENEEVQSLVLAADQFIISPATRQGDIAWSHAIGEEARTIIAGYHWFTDWGRDTMISLEGLTLVTGRFQEANYIIMTFAHYIKNGLIPNMFPDGKTEGLYHTADATLWFFHAIDRYLKYSKDYSKLEFLLPKLREVIELHIKGTDFGIHLDPSDYLLVQGQEGYALTWMDAKVGDLVVTPRRGKAVEINALWYNALRLMERWYRKLNMAADEAYVKEFADKCHESFNQKFWNPETGCLYDVLEGENGNDPSCRPNQIFSISLKHAVLDKKYWEPVLNVVKEKLWTPLGLRSLSEEHPEFKIVYKGNVFLRDIAYHQGTVWAWLIGPFIDAWVKVYPDKIEEAHHFLDGFKEHLLAAGVGSINEIFDAEKPYKHRGCIAQAWSVAEILRCWSKTELRPKKA